MTDKWFDEYVYQIVCNVSDAPGELVEVYKAGRPVALKAWDPMVLPLLTVLTAGCIGLYRWVMCRTVSSRRRKQLCHPKLCVRTQYGSQSTYVMG